MAGPSVAVRILADLTGFSKSVSDTATHGEASAKRLQSAFGGAIGALNQTGVLGPFGEALGGINEAIGKVVEHGKQIGPAMIGVGSALAGVGVGLSALGSKDQAAHKQLQESVQATGKDYEDYAAQVEKAVKSQEKYGHSANQTQDALRIMTQAMGDPAKALQYLGEASDLAAAKHEDLSTAATQLGRTYNGATKLLKEFGEQAGPKATVATKALESATKAATAADQAAEAAKQKLADVHTLLAGKTHLTAAEQLRLRDAQDNVTAANAKAEAAHRKVAGAQDTVTASTHSATNALDGLGEKLKGQAGAQADTFMGRLDAMKARFEDLAANLGAKYGPAITAIGSVMAGVGAASEVMSAIMATSWFAAIWPVALVVVAIAGVGIAIYLLRDKFVEVFHWIEHNWPLLVDIIFGPFGVAATQIYQNWDAILRFFKGIPGDMRRIFDAVWGGIVDAFKAVINAVIDVWNKLHFTLPKVDVLGVHIGGETIGVPSIPHFAQGGVVEQTGLIFAHAGETVIPAGGAAGPALQINNATFNSAVDADLIAKKVEFAISAGWRAA